MLHDGPPFANGDVHVGTALNNILKDLIINHKTLRGFNAPYVPGWDCHGLPIEFKVSQDLRKAAGGQTPARRLRAAAIRKACEAYARKYIDLQRAQFKRLGILGDWDNPYLTLDKEYEADELRLFADIVEQGFVYRGKKPVYWSIPCRTALAEAEVEYKDHVSPSIYVKFPIVGQPGTFVVIWTTTPWTLPANLAVAYNSTLQLRRWSGPATSSSSCSARCCRRLPKNAAGRTTRSCAPSGRGTRPPRIPAPVLRSHRPVVHRATPLWTTYTGTGFVHVAPGHGLEDYRLGSQHGLPIYSPVDDDGCFAHTNDLPADQQMPAAMLGKAILEKHGKSEANEAVLHELRVRRRCCTRKTITIATPTAGAAKRPSSSAPWTSGLLRSTTVVLPDAKAEAAPSPADAGMSSGNAPLRKSTG